MIKGQDLPTDRLYEREHIVEVMASIEKGFRRYFAEFKMDLDQHFGQTLEKFEKENPKYREVLHPDTLEEYGYDPNAFKGALQKECPIIHKALFSPAQVMDDYRASFYGMAGEQMLKVATAIVEFAHEYAETFDESEHENAAWPNDFGISELDSEQHTAYGVIGGGIRSQFLYQLYPSIFPSRSHDAVWALYFLSDRRDFGFEDGSEFLMIYPDGRGTQQNYFYPYDLFTYYALFLYLLLSEACKEMGWECDPRYRYLYVDSFLGYIADRHREDIRTLKPPDERFNY